MPDDYYVSQYSGEEIDALLGIAGAGAVRYDAAQTLTDAQKTQARGNIDAANRATQNKVQAVSVPSRSVTVAASELAAYIAALPRLLTENLMVNITGGTVSENLNLRYFYGPGSLQLMVVDGQTVHLTNGVAIYRCEASILLDNLSLHGLPPGEAFVYIRESTNTWLSRCTIDGAEAAGKNLYGVNVEGLSMAYIGQCDIKNVSTAVLASLSAAIVSACTGSGNTVGAYTYRGGRCYLSGGTPTLMGGNSNVNSGGPIFSNGTLL